jgi:phospholipid/cholesterol/gamma-HCH transport system substrate-binding protein
VMQSQRESAIVGLFVLIAGAIVFGAVFAMTGALAGSTTKFHTHFQFAGGLEPGATVRYAGGPKVGRVESVQLDPKNPAQLDIVFSIQSNLPVKTDSNVKIMSMSPLGDNHLEIFPGSAQALKATSGALLPSQKYVDFNSLTAQIDDFNPQVRELLNSLNNRASEVKETIARVNDLLSPQNRANLAASLANTRGLIEENRPQINATLRNANAISEKLQPLLEDFRQTSAEANQALSHIDSIVGENRGDVRQAVVDLRRTLTNMTDATGRLDQTLDVNSGNIDELLDNMRHVTENLKEFTATIKTRPYTLIHASNPPEHNPGGQQ